MLLDTHQSVYREKLLQHLLIGELLKLSWLRHGALLEVSQPALDRAGHDLVLESHGITRHVQLKSSTLTAAASGQNIHVGLGAKPSGCVVWTRFDPATLRLGPFLFFGATPGQPLPPLDSFRVARHAKANTHGLKTERPNIRVVPKARFQRLDSVEALHLTLFGT